MRTTPVARSMFIGLTGFILWASTVSAQLVTNWVDHVWQGQMLHIRTRENIELMWHRPAEADADTNNYRTRVVGMWVDPTNAVVYDYGLTAGTNMQVRRERAGHFVYAVQNVHLVNPGKIATNVNYAYSLGYPDGRPYNFTPEHYVVYTTPTTSVTNAYADGVFEYDGDAQYCRVEVLDTNVLKTVYYLRSEWAYGTDTNRTDGLFPWWTFWMLPPPKNVTVE